MKEQLIEIFRSKVVIGDEEKALAIIALAKTEDDHPDEVFKPGERLNALQRVYGEIGLLKDGEVFISPGIFILLVKEIVRRTNDFSIANTSATTSAVISELTKKKP